MSTSKRRVTVSGKAAGAAPKAAPKVAPPAAAAARASGGEPRGRSTSSLDHADEVSEVKARIEELLDEVLGTAADGSPESKFGRAGADDEEAAPAQPVESDDSDEDFYERFGTVEACELARSRLQALMARQRTDERDDMMREVAGWLRGRSHAARRDISMLSRMDQDCSKRGGEFDGAPDDIAGVLQQHGQGTAAAMQEFCQTLGKLQSMKRARAQQGRKSLDLRGLTKKGDLEAVVDEAQERLQEKEAEVWQLLRELMQTEVHPGSAFQLNLPPAPETHAAAPDTMQRASSQSAASDVMQRVTSRASADQGEAPLSGDVIEEAEKMLEYLKDAVRTTEKRTGLLKEGLDHVNRGVGMEDFESFGPMLQGEALAVLTDMRDQVSENILPELMEERNRVHGDELQPPDESQLERYRAEADRLSEKIANISQVLASFHTEGVFEADLAEQMRCLDAGFMPRGFLFQQTLEAVDMGQVETNEDEEDDDEEEEQEGAADDDDTSSVATTQPTQPKLMAMRTEEDLTNGPRARLQRQEDAIRAAAQTYVDDNGKLHLSLMQAARLVDNLEGELEGLEERANITRSTIAIVEEHKALFLGAERLASKRGGGGGVGGGGPSPGSPRTRKLQAPWGGAQKALAEKPSAEQKAADLLDQDSWIGQFLVSEHDPEAAEALTAQSEILHTLIEEEKRLDQERRQLELACEQRLEQLAAVGELGLGSVGASTLAEVNACAEVSRAAMVEFERSLQALTHFGGGTCDVMTEEFAASMSARRAAVEAAKTSLARGEPEEDRPAGGDPRAPTLRGMLRLQEEAQKVAAQISRTAQQVDELRAARPKSHLSKGVVMKARKEGAKAREARQVRQQLRNLAALRAELRAAGRDEIVHASANAADRTEEDIQAQPSSHAPGQSTPQTPSPR